MVSKAFVRILGFLNTIGVCDPVETPEYFFTKIVYVPYNFFLRGPNPVSL